MSNGLTVRINSFSFHKSGIPEDMSGNNGGFVFDCRFLPNPGREEQYKEQTGMDTPVIEYFSQYHIISEFLGYVFKIADAVINNYQERNFSHIMFSFGCTGGQHRSVYCAENLAMYLQEKNINVDLHHIELENMGKINQTKQPY